MTFKEISFDNDGKLRRLDKVENFQSNQEHEIFLNQTHIRYLYEPLINKDLHPPLDLGANFETYKNRDVFEEQLGQQRRWLVAKANTIPSASLKEVVGANIFTYRGLLNTVAVTPFARTDPNFNWVVLACKIGNVVFLCEEENQDKNRFSEENQRWSYYGHKFEQLITSDQQGVPPNNDIPVNTHEQSFSIYRGVFGRNGDEISCLYTAEMDCVDSEGKDMEIKTEFGNVNRNNPKLHRKYLKWYIQSYLVGIQNIVVGKKVDDTHVNKVAIYDLEDLRRQGQKHWNLDKCMTFLHDYLKTVKNELDTKPEGEILLTKYDPSYQTKVNFTWESANSAYAFLPEEFKQRFAI